MRLIDTHWSGCWATRSSTAYRPAMQNAAFAAGLELVLRTAVRCTGPRSGSDSRAAALGFRGANVTIPHKQAVVPHLDAVSEEARAIGAANTSSSGTGAGWATTWTASAFWRRSRAGCDRSRAVARWSWAPGVARGR